MANQIPVGAAEGAVPVGAADGAAVFQHPMSDKDIIKVFRPTHDGKEETWQAFIYQADVYANDIHCPYVLRTSARIQDAAPPSIILLSVHSRPLI